ncbi:protein RarD [Zafaria cholistanensis]|uniref:Protein RarD n=1 Tax=Zafaria cholistanensis TaxID=1682741 RepID=A0A5A7NKN1_9MICC|nr:EamA family transporter RarD [Zafaria cholistanensis]GER21524.1 protein RarD [Zafaria cholistanensis]
MAFSPAPDSPSAPTTGAAAPATAGPGSRRPGPEGLGSPRSGAERKAGLLLGLGAYGIWGLLPLYFALLAPAGPLEIVAVRVLWSVAFCVLLIAAGRQWRELGAVLRNRAALLKLSLAALLIGVNWLVFAFAVLAGRALEASLGYFINPLVAVLLGVVLLKERLNRLQWSAMGIGLAAVLLLTFASGSPPWIALALAGTFGLYGLVKKNVGANVGALAGLTVETAALTPPAALAMAWLGMTGAATAASHGAAHFWLLAAGGIITALPLILFSAAARRLPLSVVGMLQYVAPVMQFLLALLVFHEEMPPERWAGFGLIWAALVLLSADMVRGARASAHPRARRHRARQAVR